MSIAITADFHIHNFNNYASIDPETGRNTRLLNVCKCVDWIGAEAAKKRCKTLFILGDVFHGRRSIDVTALEAGYECVRSLRDKHHLKVFIVEGNHDTSITGEGARSINVFDDIAEVINEPEVVAVEGIKIGLIPYTESDGDVRKAIKRFTVEKVKIVMGHLGVIGGKVGPADIEIPGKIDLESLMPQSFLHVFLGHYHNYQKLGNLMYVGSPIQHDWGERGHKKGFVVFHERTGEAMFIENTFSPKFILVDGKTKVEGVRKLDFTKIRATSHRELEEKAEALGLEAGDVHPEIVAASEFIPRIDFAGKTHEQILSSYVKDMETDLDSKKLVEIGSGLIDRALSET